MSAREAYDVAQVIARQIGWGVLASLGARGLISVDEQRGALRFAATILPYRKDGTRSEKPRTMTVQVTLTGRDDYDVRVTYKDGAIREAVHFEESGIYAEQLSRTLLALDSDTDKETP